MNFFEQQDKARKNTTLLIGLFGFSVATMTGCIYLATVIALNVSTVFNAGCAKVRTQTPDPNVPSQSESFNAPATSTRASLVGYHYHSYSRPSSFYSRSSYRKPSCSDRQLSDGWWQPQILLWVLLITSAVVGGASLKKISELKEGGSAIAFALDGRLVLPESANEEERQMLNVVEEMAIASGIPVPYVYVMDREDEINAFAAGFTPQEAVIGLTRGSLTHLSRDELQGMIGHEFSHILNGDMGLNIRLMGLLHGILYVYLAGSLMVYGRSDRDNGALVLGLSLMIIGSSGLLCGRLIQSAISRQREFLADASAVQFTRNPEGVASALEKAATVGSRIVSPYAETARHMFFANAMGRAWRGGWFDTHPPLPQRIGRIGGVKLKSSSSRGSSFSTGESGMGLTDSTAEPFTSEPTIGLSLDRVWTDCLILFSALASERDRQPEAIAFTFRTGLFQIPGASQQSIPAEPPIWTQETLQQSLAQLKQATSQLKKSIVNACAHLVLLDGEVTVTEAALLREIAIELDRPIPPFLNVLR